jgi:hypothetical protein
VTQSALPAAPAVNAARLRDALDVLLAARPGRVRRRLAGLSLRAATYYSSFRMAELDVQWDNGTALKLVFKDLGPRSLLPEAGRCKPQFLLDPRREINVYRGVLDPHRLGPRFLGAVEDLAAGEYWLFVEKVDGAPLWQVADLTAWQAAARWAARMHGLLASDHPAVAGQANLIRYDEAYYRRWTERAGQRTAGGDGAASLLRILDNYDAVVRRLVRLPVTFIHGEYHASNILVRRTPARGSRVCPVDWEMAAIGPALMDLADLTAGKWTEAQRAAIISAYRHQARSAPPHRRLGDAPQRPGTETFDLDLDHCRLHRAVQWLGWSDGWAPPREHAQDWLGEAVRLGRKLSLI